MVIGVWNDDTYGSCACTVSHGYLSPLPDCWAYTVLDVATTCVRVLQSLPMCVVWAEFMGGSCHRGLRQGAEYLLEDAKDDLVKALSQNAGYRLVLCGHSLGGGARSAFLAGKFRRKRE